MSAQSIPGAPVTWAMDGPAPDPREPDPAVAAKYLKDNSTAFESIDKLANEAADAVDIEGLNVMIAAAVLLFQRAFARMRQVDEEL